MESLNQLIERLQHLHLEQERILKALENMANGVGTIQGNEQDMTSAVPVAVPVPPVAVPEPTVFYIGQRVYITNRITHVLVRHATEADRTAIVTHFTTSRIAIRTINGFHTH
jgi:hypothetical protein